MRILLVFVLGVVLACGPVAEPGTSDEPVAAYTGPYLWECDFTLRCSSPGVIAEPKTYYGGEWCERTGSEANARTEAENCPTGPNACSCTTYCTRATDSRAQYIKC